ncbi:MAG: hypothetical protein Ct9H300mP11_03980 [Chloroflexota bacterium]|nr:MAG: hypothetical protein Ct9H300mP11_03980 [Chloroflexota bacterium]
MEIRKQTDEAMRRTPAVIKEVYEEFKREFGRGDPSPFIEEYMCEDAEIILVGMGTLAMPTRVAVRRMREAGEKGRVPTNKILQTLRHRRDSTST